MSAPMRYFFAVTLNRTMNYLQMQLYESGKTMPTIITKEEAAELIGNYHNIKHKT